MHITTRNQAPDPKELVKQRKPPTYGDADVRVRDLVLAQLALQVRGDPYGPEGALLGQDELRVEHLRLPYSVLRRSGARNPSLA